MPERIARNANAINLRHSPTAKHFNASEDDFAASELALDLGTQHTFQKTSGFSREERGKPRADEGDPLDFVKMLFRNSATLQTRKEDLMTSAITKTSSSQRGIGNRRTVRSELHPSPSNRVR